MRNDKMREEFEAWAKTQNITIDLLWREAYVAWEAQFAFDAWQASREALVIELPPHIAYDRELCIEAIEAAGLRAV